MDRLADPGVPEASRFGGIEEVNNARCVAAHVSSVVLDAAKVNISLAGLAYSPISHFAFKLQGFLPV